MTDPRATQRPDVGGGTGRRPPWPAPGGSAGPGRPARGRFPEPPAPARRRERRSPADTRVTLADGCGGAASAAVLDDILPPALREQAKAEVGDGFCVETPPGRFLVRSDTFAAVPLVFPGGSIGDLAVNGTVNDLAVRGARPLWLACDFLLEEGLALDAARLLVDAVSDAARAAGVTLVPGAVTVVPRAQADTDGGCYLTTTGIGLVAPTGAPPSERPPAASGGRVARLGEPDETAAAPEGPVLRDPTTGLSVPLRGTPGPSRGLPTFPPLLRDPDGAGGLTADPDVAPLLRDPGDGRWPPGRPSRPSAPQRPGDETDWRDSVTGDPLTEDLTLDGQVIGDNPIGTGPIERTPAPDSGAPSAGGAATAARAQAGLSMASARPGDVIVVSGPVGEHGIAVMLARRGEPAEVVSDTAPLTGLVERMLAAVHRGGGGVRAMRAPTRAGVAGVLEELASAAGVGVVVDEGRVPVRAPVRDACARLGLHPLRVACEGRLVAVVAPEAVTTALDALRHEPLGTGAAVIGQVVEDRPGEVMLRSVSGETRVFDPEATPFARVR